MQKINVTVISKIPFASTSVNGTLFPLEPKRKHVIFRNNIHRRKSLSGVENTKALKALLERYKTTGAA